MPCDLAAVTNPTLQMPGFEPGHMGCKGDVQTTELPRPVSPLLKGLISRLDAHSVTPHTHIEMFESVLLVGVRALPFMPSNPGSGHCLEAE